MTAVLLAGGGVGLGLWLVLRGLWPSQASLVDRLAELRVTGEEPLVPRGRARAGSGSGDEATGRELAFGRTVLSTLDDLGLPMSGLRHDLAVTERSMEAFAARKAIGAVLAALFVPAAAALLAVAGLRLPLLVTGALTLGAAVGGFLLPDLSLRQEAAARRRDFREAAGIWLDLVSVSLAGGAGIEEAMTTTSATGQGWAFNRLRDTLERARLTGETPWAALGRLGEHLDLAELRELAASLALAGTEGARVRRSLAAKAASLRQHEVAEAESAAAGVTERLVLPVGLLLFGFVMFLGFPAMLRILTSV